jgi:hypothetical protein
VVVLRQDKEKKPRFQVLPTLSLILSAIALSISTRVAYIQYWPHNEVVARAINFSFMPGNGNTDPDISVDVAVVNRGNQAEIIRGLVLSYSYSNTLRADTQAFKELNQRIEKGGKEVFRLKPHRDSVCVDHPVTISVGVVAIGPDLSDIESIWPLYKGLFSSDGRGGGGSYLPSAEDKVHVVSNERLPHQHPFQFW